MTINCKGESLILDKDRAIYWPSKKMLIVSDLHVGKAAHFRKAGLPVPATVTATDLEKLSSLIYRYTPDILLITGDLFHHKMNTEVQNFQLWRQQYPEIRLILIKGNHDLLDEKTYAELAIEIHKKELICAPFRFIHDQPQETDTYYNITGHIHPGITITGKARQRIKLPCFYFGTNCAILPAFSLFTGLSKIKAKDGDSFYAITSSDVIAI